MLRVFFAVCLLLAEMPLSLAGQVFAEPDSQTQEVIVRKVLLSKPNPLSEEDLKALAGKLRAFDGTFPGERRREDLADAAARVVQTAYQDKGYFKAKTSVEVIPIRDDPGSRRVDLFVTVNEGTLYRLREIHWRNPTAFPESQLLALMPLRNGDIFSRVKVAAGLDAVRQLYGTHGYINFTCIPNTQIDEAEQNITLEIDVDEGGIFRWGELYIEGMNAPHATVLVRGWNRVRGQIFMGNPDHVLNKFFATYFRSLRPGVKPSDYVRTRLDEPNRKVDVYLSLTSDPSLLQRLPASWRESRAGAK